MAVYTVKPVALLEGAVPGVGAAVHKAVDDRRHEGSGIAVHQHDEYDAQQKVHERARAKDDELFPEALVGEGSRVLGLLILAHCAEAAYGQDAQGIQGLALLLFPDSGPHAYGELIHPDSAGLCSDEMSEFMYGDQNAEHYDCDYYIH